MASAKEKLEFELALNATEAMAALAQLTVGSKEFNTAFANTLNNVNSLAIQLGKTTAEVGATIAGMFNSSGANRFLADMRLLAAETEKLALSEAKMAGLQNVETQAMREQLALINQMAAADAQAVDVTQQKRLALENKETQEYREQLILIQQMAAADAKRIQTSQARNVLMGDIPLGAMNGPELPPSMQTGRQVGQYGKYDTGAGVYMNDLKQIGPLQAQVAAGSEKMGKSANNAAQGFNILRSAMGFMVAMGMSYVIQGIISALTKMVDSAKQAEKAIFNLAIAEKALSRAGIEISPENFKEMEKAVKATGIAISDIDITKLIANTASGTRDLKLTVKQLQDLSVATAAIAYANGKTIEEVQNTIQTSLTTSGRGLKPLDIPVDAAIIKEKALSAQLVENAAAYDALTAAEKQKVETDALLLIITDNANQILSETNSLNGSLTESTQEMGVAWENFTTVAGEVLKPVLVGLTTIGTIMMQVLSGTFKFLGIGFAEFVSGMVGGFAIIDEALKGNVKSIDDARAAYDKVYKEQRQTMYDLLFPSGLSPIELGTRSTGILSADIGKMIGAPGTTAANEPTAPKKIGGDEESNQNLLDAEKKFNQEILDAQLKLGQDLEDAAIDYERKRYDIGVEYAHKRAELEKDYATKVADINRSYSNTIADINQRQQEEKAKQRNDEMQKEREFQNQLLALKENFLMALDDALHARDARQILKLIKNYELDKSQAERKNALDKKNAAEDSALRQKSFNEDRKKAEADRQAKLAEAQRDYADKLAKLKADEDAEREAARVANERKIADLNRELQNRLEVIAAGLVEEFKLTEANLQNIVNLYKKYYSDATGILAAMRAQLAGTMGMAMQAQSMVMSRGIVTDYSERTANTYTMPSAGKPLGPSKAKPATQMAEGGTIVANRPTTVTFGENGIEAGTFMPLGRIGKDVNSLFSNLGGTGGEGSGKVSIELLLSPDLESRIVSNTLNRTAEVFTKVQRAKRAV
jgi:hypothetical protein